MMKFYLIDDALFCDGKEQTECRNRFIKHLQRNRVKQIFIHVHHEATKELHAFLHQYRTIPVYLVDDDFVLNNEDIHAYFKDQRLCIEGYDAQEAVDATCVEYDCDLKTAKRLYFDLFINHTQEQALDDLIDELETIIQERVLDLKKKKGKGF